MKKLQSTFSNMVAVLGTTTIVAGLLLGGVNMLTSEAREDAELNKRFEALRELTGQFNNDPQAEAQTVITGSGHNLTVYPATVDGVLTGAVVESSSGNGFSGEIRIMTGFTTDGTITGYKVMYHSETPGLGAKMTEWFTGSGNRSIIGRIPEQTPLKVSKDGGTVDGITAATISSRAFLEAVNDAAEAFKQYKEGKQ